MTTDGERLVNARIRALLISTARTSIEQCADELEAQGDLRASRHLNHARDELADQVAALVMGCAEEVDASEVQALRAAIGALLQGEPA